MTVPRGDTLAKARTQPKATTGTATLQRQWRQTCVLAWRDFLHEWRVSLCLVLALAAVLAPLLVLFGLKSGIVTTMSERLKADPRNLELTLRGHYQLDPEWFRNVAARPDVRFMVPRTRILAATLSLETAAGSSLLDLDMIPTAAGDPLLGTGLRPIEGLTEILLTQTAAGKLNARVGDRVTATVSRRLNDQAQAVQVMLTVAGIVSESAFGRDAVFVSLPLLVATEDYRDGYQVAEFATGDGSRERPAVRSFASMRLYASQLDDVAPLAEWLRDQGLEVVTRAKDIETVKAIDRVLTFVFVILASIGVVGYLLSLATSLWANVDRKRREIALLRLIGLGTAPVVGFPAIQAALVAIGGVALAAVVYVAVAAAFNATFASELNREEFVCRLALSDGVAAGLLTLVFALVASVVGGYRAAKIDPAEGLRAL
jgi:putative ABC transport system permease protein